MRPFNWKAVFRLTLKTIGALSFISAVGCVSKKDVQAMLAPYAKVINSPQGSLSSSSYTPSLNASPALSIEGLEAGDTIGVYSDANCSNVVHETQASGSSLTVQLADLAPGAHVFYFDLKRNGVKSDCSEEGVEYLVQSCPTNYSAVYGNSDLGTNDFCLMKYEAKDDGSGNAVSQANGPAWGGLDQNQAKAACEAIGQGYDLVSNPEWLTAAYEIESIDENWSGGAVGSGCIFRGNNGDSDACGYNFGAIDQGSGRDVKARLTLKSSDTVWDLSGNAWEWVDYTLGGSLGTLSSGCDADIGFIDLKDVSTCSTLLPIDYLPNNPTSIADSAYDRSFGIGAMYVSTGVSILRGTNFNDGSNGGIYSLSNQVGPTFSDGSVSFRCVYRP